MRKSILRFKEIYAFDHETWFKVSTYSKLKSLSLFEYNPARANGKANMHLKKPWI